MKKILLIELLSILFLSVHLQAQIIKPSDTADHLLWYVGKLIAKNKLKLPGGGTVTYNPSTGTVTVDGTSANDPLKTLEDKLNNEKKDEENDDKQILSEQPAGVNYGLAQSYNAAFEKVDAEYKSILSNQITLPQDNSPDPQKQAEQNFVQSMFSEGCPKMKADFDEIMAFYNAHRHDDPNSFNLPEPPRQDYDNCWQCFPHKQDEYDTLVAYYLKEVNKPESDLISKGLGIEKTMALLGLQTQFNNGEGGLENLNDQLYGSKSNPTPCSWLPGCDYDLKKALDFLVEREVQKGAYLFKKYRKDYYHLSAAVRVCLSAERSYCLYSGNDREQDAILAEIGGAMGSFKNDYFNRIFSKHDWTQLPNVGFLLELMREYELLGGSAGNEVDDFLKADRFKLSVDVDCKLGGNGEYQLAHISGDNYIRFSSVDSPQCIIAQVITGASTDIKGTNVLQLKLQTTEFVVPQNKAQFTYTGSNDWYTFIPDFRFHGCSVSGDDKDTIIVHQLSPKGDQEKWFMKAPQYGQEMDINYTQNLLMSCFLNKKETMNEAGKAKDNKTQEAMKDSARAMAMRMLQQRGIDPNSVMKQAQKPASVQNTISQTEQVVTQQLPYAPGNYLFTDPLKNGSPELFNQKLDGTKLFPENKKIIYAYFTLKITHETDKTQTQ